MSMVMFTRYLLHILIAIDQVFTTLFGGYPDETVSSYLHRLDQRGRLAGKVFRPVVDWLFSWQGLEGGHCRAAHQEERNRVQMPLDLR